MYSSKTDRATSFIHKTFKIILILQIIILFLIIIYSVLGLDFPLFFTTNFVPAIRDFPFSSDFIGQIRQSDGTLLDFKISSALGTIRFPDDSVAVYKIMALRQVFFNLIGILVVYIFLKISKSLIEKKPFTLLNAKRIRLVAFIILGVSILNSIFIFQMGVYFQNRVLSEVIVPNINLHLNYTVLFLGSLLLIISEVFRLGVTITEEQKLII